MPDGTPDQDLVPKPTDEVEKGEQINQLITNQWRGERREEDRMKLWQ